MMHQGGQGAEGRHPSSPRGSSNNNMSKFSLLGQQLTTYGTASQQHHQNPSNHANMDFSLGGHAQQPPSLTQSFTQGHAQSQSSNGGGVGCSDGGGRFPGMQNVNSLVNVGAAPGFNQNHQQFINQQVMQGNGGADFLKASQQQAGVESLGTPEVLHNVLQVFQQSLGQLQAMVPYLAQNQQFTNPLCQQQAAAAAGAVRMIAQIAQAAANFLPNTQQPSSVPDPQQLSMLFGASVAPGFNFFQQGGLAPLNDPAGNGMANNFPRLQGGSGANVGIGASSGSFANQAGGVPGGNPQNSGSGIVGTKGGSPQVGQVFGAQGGGGNNGSGSATSGMTTSNTKLGSPHNNQIGSGISRVGAISNSLSGDVAQMVLNNPGMPNCQMEDHDVGGVAPRDDDDDGDAENLPPGSYELVEMNAMEILAEHTHFCEICGKGFKRDANLRMHMRGHGDEYKTPAALARPDRASHDASVIRPRRFSCPFLGCKRNKKHRKFQPLKTMLCVKNHYRRSHCPKDLTCQKCQTKKFSVVADLKTHEKHCGCDKWQCSCGTTFSRKDKLFGHIGLFAGHTPAVPFNEVDTAGSVEDIGGGTPPTMHVSGNSSSGGFGGGNLNSGNTAASNMGLGGGSGMGLSSGGLQGLATRGANNLSKDVVSVGQENSSSSDSFSQSGNLLPASSMLQGFFTANFLQNTSGGNNSTDALQ